MASSIEKYWHRDRKLLRETDGKPPPPSPPDTPDLGGPSYSRAGPRRKARPSSASSGWSRTASNSLDATGKNRPLWEDRAASGKGRKRSVRRVGGPPRSRSSAADDGGDDRERRQIDRSPTILDDRAGAYGGDRSGDDYDGGQPETRSSGGRLSARRPKSASIISGARRRRQLVDATLGERLWRPSMQPVPRHKLCAEQEGTGAPVASRPVRGERGGATSARAHGGPSAPTFSAASPAASPLLPASAAVASTAAPPGSVGAEAVIRNAVVLYLRESGPKRRAQLERRLAAGSAGQLGVGEGGTSPSPLATWDAQSRVVRKIWKAIGRNEASGLAERTVTIAESVLNMARAEKKIAKTRASLAALQDVLMDALDVPAGCPAWETLRRVFRMASNQGAPGTLSMTPGMVDKQDLVKAIRSIPELRALLQARPYLRPWLNQTKELGGELLAMDTSWNTHCSFDEFQLFTLIYVVPTAIAMRGPVSELELTDSKPPSTILDAAGGDDHANDNGNGNDNDNGSDNGNEHENSDARSAARKRAAADDLEDRFQQAEDVTRLRRVLQRPARMDVLRGELGRERFQSYIAQLEGAVLGVRDACAHARATDADDPCRTMPLVEFAGALRRKARGEGDGPLGQSDEARRARLGRASPKTTPETPQPLGVARAEAAPATVSMRDLNKVLKRCIGQSVEDRWVVCLSAHFGDGSTRAKGSRVQVEPLLEALLGEMPARRAEIVEAAFWHLAAASVAEGEGKSHTGMVREVASEMKRSEHGSGRSKDQIEGSRIVEHGPTHSSSKVAEAGDGAVSANALRVGSQVETVVRGVTVQGEIAAVNNNGFGSGGGNGELTYNIDYEGGGGDVCVPAEDVWSLGGGERRQGHAEEKGQGQEERQERGQQAAGTVDMGTLMPDTLPSHVVTRTYAAYRYASPPGSPWSHRALCPVDDLMDRVAKAQAVRSPTSWWPAHVTLERWVALHNEISTLVATTGEFDRLVKSVWMETPTLNLSLLRSPVPATATYVSSPSRAITGTTGTGTGTGGGSGGMLGFGVSGPRGDTRSPSLYPIVVDAKKTWAIVDVTDDERERAMETLDGPVSSSTLAKAPPTSPAGGRLMNQECFWYCYETGERTWDEPPFLVARRAEMEEHDRGLKQARKAKALLRQRAAARCELQCALHDLDMALQPLSPPSSSSPRTVNAFGGGAARAGGAPLVEKSAHGTVPLIGLNMAAVPRAVASVSPEELWLSGNELGRGMAEMGDDSPLLALGEMWALRRLELDHNGLIGVPAPLMESPSSCLPVLVTLNMADNDLTIFPPEHPAYGTEEEALRREGGEDRDGRDNWDSRETKRSSGEGKGGETKNGGGGGGGGGGGRSSKNGRIGRHGTGGKDGPKGVDDTIAAIFLLLAGGRASGGDGVDGVDGVDPAAVGNRGRVAEDRVLRQAVADDMSQRERGHGTEHDAAGRRPGDTIRLGLLLDALRRPVGFGDASGNAESPHHTPHASHASIASPRLVVRRVRDALKQCPPLAALGNPGLELKHIYALQDMRTATPQRLSKRELREFCRTAATWVESYDPRVADPGMGQAGSGEDEGEEEEEGGRGGLDTFHGPPMPLAQLRSVDLRRNRITSLNAPGLRALRSLRFLDISGNALTELPAAIGALRALRTLRASNNKITSLSGDIRKCGALRVLDLGHNKLKVLQSDVTWIRGLEELYVNHNFLTALPGWRENIAAGMDDDGGEGSAAQPHLRILSAHHNQLLHCPTWVNRFSSLEELRLDHNALESLPHGFGGIPPRNGESRHSGQTEGKNDRGGEDDEAAQIFRELRDPHASSEASTMSVDKRTIINAIQKNDSVRRILCSSPRLERLLMPRAFAEARRSLQDRVTLEDFRDFLTLAAPPARSSGGGEDDAHGEPARRLSSRTALASAKARGGLASLRVLTLSWNRLTSLPTSLPLGFGEAMVSLEELDLGHNHLGSDECLASLKHCRALKRLDFTTNAIAQLGEPLALPSSAQHVNGHSGRSGNKGSKPCFLQDLADLQELDLSHNRLRILPESAVGSLRSLRVLCLHGNDFSGDPELRECVRVAEQGQDVPMDPLAGLGGRGGGKAAVDREKQRRMALSKLLHNVQHRWVTTIRRVRRAAGMYGEKMASSKHVLENWYNLRWRQTEVDQWMHDNVRPSDSLPQHPLRVDAANGNEEWKDWERREEEIWAELLPGGQRSSAKAKGGKGSRGGREEENPFSAGIESVQTARELNPTVHSGEPAMAGVAHKSMDFLSQRLFRCLACFDEPGSGVMGAATLQACLKAIGSTEPHLSNEEIDILVNFATHVAAPDALRNLGGGARGGGAGGDEEWRERALSSDAMTATTLESAVDYGVFVCSMYNTAPMVAGGAARQALDMLNDPHLRQSAAFAEVPLPGSKGGPVDHGAGATGGVERISERCGEILAEHVPRMFRDRRARAENARMVGGGVASRMSAAHPAGPTGGGALASGDDRWRNGSKAIGGPGSGGGTGVRASMSRGKAIRLEARQLREEVDALDDASAQLEGKKEELQGYIKDQTEHAFQLQKEALEARKRQAAEGGVVPPPAASVSLMGGGNRPNEGMGHYHPPKGHNLWATMEEHRVLRDEKRIKTKQLREKAKRVLVLQRKAAEAEFGVRQGEAAARVTRAADAAADRMGGGRRSTQQSASSDSSGGRLSVAEVEGGGGRGKKPAPNKKLYGGAAFTQYRTITRDEVMQQLGAFDTDGSGLILLEDLELVLREMGIISASTGGDMLQPMVAVAEANEGLIDYSEFVVGVLMTSDQITVQLPEPLEQRPGEREEEEEEEGGEEAEERPHGNRGRGGGEEEEAKASTLPGSSRPYGTAGKWHPQQREEHEKADPRIAPITSGNRPYGADQFQHELPRQEERTTGTTGTTGTNGTSGTRAEGGTAMKAKEKAKAKEKEKAKKKVLHVQRIVNAALRRGIQPDAAFMRYDQDDSGMIRSEHIPLALRDLLKSVNESTDTSSSASTSAAPPLVAVRSSLRAATTADVEAVLEAFGVRAEGVGAHSTEGYAYLDYDLLLNSKIAADEEAEADEIDRREREKERETRERAERGMSSSSSSSSSLSSYSSLSSGQKLLMAVKSLREAPHVHGELEGALSDLDPAQTGQIPVRDFAMLMDRLLGTNGSSKAGRLLGEAVAALGLLVCEGGAAAPGEGSGRSTEEFVDYDELLHLAKGGGLLGGDDDSSLVVKTTPTGADLWASVCLGNDAVQAPSVSSAYRPSPSAAAAAAPTQQHTVHVVNPSGATVARLAATTGDTWFAMKRKLEFLCGVPVGDQVLLCGKHRVEDGDAVLGGAAGAARTRDGETRVKLLSC